MMVTNPAYQCFVGKVRTFRIFCIKASSIWATPCSLPSKPYRGSTWNKINKKGLDKDKFHKACHPKQSLEFSSTPNDIDFWFYTVHVQL